MKSAASSASSTDKHFRCTICQRGFTRIDHLKRHHLRHSGLKPYSCVFCNESFARCDNLRDHYANCAKRGDQQVPSTSQRGRRRHACQSCTSMKLRCDGDTPCGSCRKRNLPCNKERKSQLKNGPDSAVGPSKGNDDSEQSSDRGSIKFLLNGGTDSFTERFLLPPRSDRARGLEYHNMKGLQEDNGAALPYNMKQDQMEYAPAFIDSDPVTMSFFQDTFVNFFNNPFGDPTKPMDDPYQGGVAYQTVIPPNQDPSLTLPGQQPPFEPERPFASAMIQSILTRAWTVPLDGKAQEEISHNLHFLLATSRVRRFVAMYFKYWHQSCAMIHPPSFDPETVSLPLLTAVVFMGAMYSGDEREVYAAKRVLDFAELFVFSSDVFSSESEIGAAFCGNRNLDEEANDWVQFQNLQAGFITIITQYWAGSRESRNRVMENRFSEVIKVARKTGLLKCRHLPQDRIQEYLWIQKESRIRTVSIISLLDCAFSFYQNYPCRLSHTEMDSEFPCYNAIFNSEHPFAEPNFRFSRDLIISEAFQSLFEDYPTQNPSPSPISEGSQMSLTVFDMFMLIHLLYVFTNTHMTLLAVMRKHHAILPSISPGGSGVDAAQITAIPDDAVLDGIRTALTRWREHWDVLRAQVPREEWASMGFYKNGYNFWLVSQLLITKKESIDVVMQMEIKCEDKLEKLKVLLMDEN
ncbi:hypothetical protein ASPWEDRAFT_35893, partial [Aspergillus wentii DTO 134E9]